MTNSTKFLSATLFGLSLLTGGQAAVAQAPQHTSGSSSLPRCEGNDTAAAIKAMTFPDSFKVLALKEAREVRFNAGNTDNEKRSCSATALTTVRVLRADYTIQWFSYGNPYFSVQFRDLPSPDHAIRTEAPKTAVRCGLCSVYPEGGAWVCDDTKCYAAPVE